MKQTFLLGTYTKRKSKGIYSIELDTNKKTLNQLNLVCQTQNPTYLDTNIHQDIACISQKDKLGGIRLFKKSEDGYQLTHECHHQKAAPCFIQWKEDQEVILTANYHTGSICNYSFANELICNNEFTFQGSSIHKNQDQARMHFVHSTPWNTYFVACDLGSDLIYLLQLDEQKHYQICSRYKTHLGAGPRHIAFHPTLPIAYVVCELNARIEVLHFDTHTTEFSLLEQHEIVDREKKAWAAAIRITSDGKFLYISNRGYDVLVSFTVDTQTGRLSKLEEVQTFGKVARDFHMDASEQFLIVGHQDSDTLTLFERDATGRLHLCQRDIYAPEVVCVHPLPVSFKTL